MAMSVHEHWFYPKIRHADATVSNYTYPTSKVVCVGRNYLAHARELNNPVPQEPLLFIKPNSSLSDLTAGVNLPAIAAECHHEVEIAILISRRATAIEAREAKDYIAGVGLALDLTLREVQERLKKQGQPWEKAKAFDGSCPVTEFISLSEEADLANLNFHLAINDKMVQQANSSEMIFPVDMLLSDISRHFTLYPGDIVLTGTPSGVGPLNRHDELSLALNSTQWRSVVDAADE